MKLPVFSYVGCGKNQLNKQTNPNKKNNYPGGAGTYF